MKISELSNVPQWLRDADTYMADIYVRNDGIVIWYGGVWRGGVWRGGVWRGGVWCGGVWRGGVWHGGEWRGGVWRGGVWRGGVWHGGEWRGGEWRGCVGEMIQYWNPERAYLVCVVQSENQIRIDSGCRHFNSFTEAYRHWANHPETLRLLRRFDPEVIK